MTTRGTRIVSGATTLTLFFESDAAYDDMLAAIAGARQSVWLETYIFSADEIGWQFAQALVERARAGVQVRMRVDSAGALESPYSKRIRRYLHAAGVDLHWFNRLRRVLSSRINHRDHRKLLVVDGRCLYVGSSNILRGNSRRLCGDDCRRQLDVRIDGALAERMAVSGTALWDNSRHEAECAWTPVAAGDNQLVAGSAFTSDRPLRTLYRALFEQAQRTAYMTVGFFVPDDDLVRVLERTAARGVDVRLILPRHADMKATRWAAHALYSRLLGAGVRIHEYLPSVLHAKMAVVDSGWATLGSANFDFRSFYLNYELNLESRNATFCLLLHRLFLDDLERCEEVTAEAWSRRPWHGRALERLVWPVRRHL